MAELVRQVFIPLFMMVVILLYIWIVINELKKFIISFSAIFWPKTNGTILKSQIIEKPSESGTEYYADIEYSYTINSNEYTSSVTYLGALNLLARWPILYLTRKFPKGTSVVVSYNSNKPDESVLITGFNILLFNTITALIVLGIFAYFFTWTIYGLINNWI